MLDDPLSDMNERPFAARIARENRFLRLRQNLRCALTLETGQRRPFADGAVRIEQAIDVERDSRKAILLGRGGARLIVLASERPATCSIVRTRPSCRAAL